MSAPVVEVQLGDKLEIECPHYLGGTVSPHLWEYYLIYNVSTNAYRTQIIHILERRLFHNGKLYGHLNNVSFLRSKSLLIIVWGLV